MVSPLIVGVGAALVDLLIEENDAFLNSLDSQKGGMTLVDLPLIEKALTQSKANVKKVPGGSACNSLVGIGHLGGRSRMIGRLGQDALGEAFLSGIAKAGVESEITITTANTGRVLSVVTPDAQRTMFTYLGASAELHPDDILAKHFADADIVLLEGYLLFNRPVVEKILALVANSPAKLALDLGSFQVVEFCRPFLEEIVRDHVDILLANEDEAKAFTGLGEQESLEFFSNQVELAVVKLGKRGVLLSQGKKRANIVGEVVNAIDTTGAGDLWAAGFLYGLTQGYGLENSARLGCKVGAEVVQVMGASIPEAGWQRIKAFESQLQA